MNIVRQQMRAMLQRVRIAELRALGLVELAAYGASLDDEHHLLYRNLFALNAHDHQIEPEGAWTTWLILGGRGSGKTRAGAEWTMDKVFGGGAARVALIGETLADVRDVMIEGASGLRNAAMERDERPRYCKSLRKVTWPNGAEAHVFSAEDPDSLRGHEFDLAWGDEFAKWRYAQDTFDNLQLCLRSGPHPRQLITTTPRNRESLRKLLAQPGLAVTRAPTAANANNLSPLFLDGIARRYEGTRLFRQEVLGELLEDMPGGLWTREMLDRARVRAAPEMARIAVAVDPPVSTGPDADECGIIGVGKGQDGRAYVLADRSVQGLSPKAWAERAIGLYHSLKADCIVAEVNQGGNLVRTLFAEIDSSVPVRSVHASRGKHARAEPVAALYEQGRVSHVGALGELEDQMCLFGGQEAGDGSQDTGAGNKSPDRVDALVWAVWELMLRREPEFRVRRV